MTRVPPGSHVVVPARSRTALGAILPMVLCTLVAAGLFGTAFGNRAPVGSFLHSGPKQEEPADATPWVQRGYTITPLATYEIEAVVLSMRTYHDDREAEAAPLDLALGWGRMADDEVRSAFDVSQRDRWYFVRWATSPLERDDIIRSSANTHIVPASPELEDRLKSVRPGQVVRLRGYLVEVAAPDGWRWRSSLTREDTGDGACEVFWVESAEIVDASGVVAAR